MLWRSRWALSKVISRVLISEGRVFSSEIVDVNLVDHLRLTDKEKEKICENIQPLCSNPMHLLENPDSHLRFSKNLKVMMGLGLEAYEMKRMLSGM